MCSRRHLCSILFCFSSQGYQQQLVLSATATTITFENVIVQNMADSEEGFSGQISHLYLGNIPKELRSADLRAFFSQFIESKAFHCFHFRHRPEEKAAPESDSHATACSNSRSAELTGTILLEAAVETERNKTQSETCCCIIQAYENRVAELMKTYNRVCWLDRNNKIHSRKVALCKIRLRKKSEKEGIV